MKKTFKNLFLGLATMVVFLSCGEEDNLHPIVGTWKMDASNEARTFTMTFKEDENLETEDKGSDVTSYIDDKEIEVIQKDYGTWTTKEDSVSLAFTREVTLKASDNSVVKDEKDETNISYKYQIEGNKLQLFYTTTDSEGNMRTEEITLTKQ